MQHIGLPSQQQQVLKLAQATGLVRASELAAHGLPRTVLSRLVEQGALVRVARGLYALADAPVTEHQTLVEAVLRVPGAVVCLLSALRFHGLTTQAPHEVWLALARGRSGLPQVPELTLHFVTLQPALLEIGVESHRVQGVPLRVTSPARTVADCFKFRNKLGLDVAIEALKAYRHQRVGTLDELHAAALSCRVANVIQPYLEAIG